MNSNDIGNLGEAVAITYFTKQGYEVFVPLGVASSVDMVILKNGVASRVSVKSSNRKVKSGKCEISLRQKYRKKNIHFDNDSCDMVFLYCIYDDRFEILESKDIVSKSSITF